MVEEKLTWEDLGKVWFMVCPKCGGDLSWGPYRDIGPLRCMDCGWFNYVPLSRREITDNHRKKAG